MFRIDIIRLHASTNFIPIDDYIDSVNIHPDLCHYCQTYNIRHALVGNKIVDHSDVVGA